VNIQNGQEVIILLLTYHVDLYVSTSAVGNCETQKWCVITLPALVCAQNVLWYATKLEGGVW
jgi:hypothetical protein